jgi:hypothetical protein
MMFRRLFGLSASALLSTACTQVTLTRREITRRKQKRETRLIVLFIPPRETVNRYVMVPTVEHRFPTGPQ